ncbi:MAG: hypothetical protein AAB955_02625 [Patescibacteria group bacterium]
MEYAQGPELFAKIETVTIEITNRDIDLAKDDYITNITVLEKEIIFEITGVGGKSRSESMRIPDGFKIVGNEYIYNEKHETTGFRVLFGREVKRVTEQD